MSLIETWVRDITSYGSLATIGFIFFGLLSLGKTGIAIQFFLTNFFCMVIIYVIRFFYFRARPSGAKKSYTSVADRLIDSSFPSVHGYRAAVIPMILSQLVPVYTSILLWVVGFGICFSRIYLKRHHVTDVVAGFIIGIIVSYLVMFIW